MDQGRILRAIKYSRARIITPYKMYYPYLFPEDEEDLEGDLNKSRAEYRRIKRRLKNGRIQAVQAGKYPYSVPPLGFKAIKSPDGIGYILEEDPNESYIVKRIFYMFVHERKGTVAIEREIYAMGYRSRKGKRIDAGQIRRTLRILTYIGFITWGRHYTETILVNGKLVNVTRASDDFIIAKAKFPGFIDPEDFIMADKLLKEHRHPPIPHAKQPRNPLAGIMKCSKCGRTMISKMQQGILRYQCPTIGCPTVGHRVDTVEDKLVYMLEDYFQNLTLEASQTDIDNNLENDIKSLEFQNQELEKNIKKVQKQYTNACEFFEQNIYDAQTFQSRANVLKEEESNLIKILADNKKQLNTLIKKKNQKQTFLPKVEQVITLYRQTTDIGQKNQLLKSILDKVIYEKEKGGTPFNLADFTLYVYPKLSA